MPDRDWWQALWPDPENLLRAIGIRPEMTVLDLCCGDGYFTAPMASLVNGKVIGLDIDPDMLDQARAEVARSGASVRQWICGNADGVEDLLSEHVDFILIANTFHGVPEQTNLARAAASILKQDGRFAVVNWDQIARECTPVLDEPRGPRTEMRMSPDQVRAVIEPAGFTFVDLVQLPPYHYAVIFRLGAAETSGQKNE
ncbi:MAG: class I SAM-dependent methyltransferase [Hyphomicrobiaceae bacterium]